MTPQLGLLKSTLLQLDSTFSEREYGVSSFRDFMEKVAKAGAVTLQARGPQHARRIGRRRIAVGAVVDNRRGSDGGTGARCSGARACTRRDGGQDAEDDGDDEEQLPASPMSLQDGIRAVQRAFTDSPPARWPLYVRQAKQHLRTAVDGFDERKYGFASVVDLLRAAGKEGVIRIERDRQGAIRVFPGANLTPKPGDACRRAGDPRRRRGEFRIWRRLKSCRRRWRIRRSSMWNLSSNTSSRWRAKPLPGLPKTHANGRRLPVRHGPRKRRARQEPRARKSVAKTA